MIIKIVITSADVYIMQRPKFVPKMSFSNKLINAKLICTDKIYDKNKQCKTVKKVTVDRST
jgi:hypothetical protein